MAGLGTAALDASASPCLASVRCGVDIVVGAAFDGRVAMWRGTLISGGVGARGVVAPAVVIGGVAPRVALCRRDGVVTGTDSSMSLSDQSARTTLRRFRLPSSSSMLSWPPVARETGDFFLEGPSSAGCFPAAFLATRSSTARRSLSCRAGSCTLIDRVWR